MKTVVCDLSCLCCYIWHLAIISCMRSTQH